MEELELFIKNNLKYELWIEYGEGVFCKSTEVDDITDALKLVDRLKKRPNVSKVYIREVRTTGNILLTEKS